MTNLDRIWQERKARLAWLREMFATKEARILFGVALLVAFVAGLVIGI